jgi:hypothetical protein
MKKSCPCGTIIPNNWYLCKECLKVYSKNKSDWPAWLAFAVADTQRQWDYNRTHDEIAYNDEYDYASLKVTVEGQYYTSQDGWGPYSDS